MPIVPSSMLTRCRVPDSGSSLRTWTMVLNPGRLSHVNGSQSALRPVAAGSPVSRHLSSRSGEVSPLMRDRRLQIWRNHHVTPATASVAERDSSAVPRIPVQRNLLHPSDREMTTSRGRVELVDHRRWMTNSQQLDLSRTLINMPRSCDDLTEIFRRFSRELVDDRVFSGFAANRDSFQTRMLSNGFGPCS